jgi:hypothetical protein
MNDTVINFALQRSAHKLEIVKQIDMIKNLGYLMSCGMQYPKDFPTYLERLAWLPKNDTLILDFLLSSIENAELPERWLLLGALAKIKFIRKTDRPLWPNLEQAFPPEAAVYARVIERSIAAFDNIYEGITLDFVREHLQSSQRTRVCMLACIYSMVDAKEPLPAGVMDLVASWNLQDHDFETGILVIMILNESNFQTPEASWKSPHWQSLADVMAMMSQFRYRGPGWW